MTVEVATGRRRRVVSAAVAVAALALCPAADGQVFLASRPAPRFAVGPVVVRAMVGPAAAPVVVDLLWSVVLAPDALPGEAAQDLFLLWPGAVRGVAGLGPPEPELARYVEARGFAVVDEGRLALLSQGLRELARSEPATAVAGGAPYVTFVLAGGPLGLSTPATWVRIPAAPLAGSVHSLRTLRLTVPSLVRPKPASWVERVFAGRRELLTLTFHDVRSRAAFPLYFEHRDRVVRLADQPSQLLVEFSGADRLKVDEVSPATSVRRPSESLENTEVISQFLDTSEGLSPQVLSVQFGYFTGLQSWAPVLVPTLFFVLGNLAAVMVRTVGERLGRVVAGRLRFGAPGGSGAQLQTGVVVPRDALARIVPGLTTYAEVQRLLGPDAEQRETLSAPAERSLLYRGRRVVPHGRRMLRWLTAIQQWDVEQHTVEVRFDGDVVRDVKAEVRRARRGAGRGPGEGPA